MAESLLLQDLKVLQDGERSRPPPYLLDRPCVCVFVLQFRIYSRLLMYFHFAHKPENVKHLVDDFATEFVGDETGEILAYSTSIAYVSWR